MANSKDQQPTFKDLFFQTFIEWEKEQPNQRSSFSAFARWLSDNRYNVKFKQQLVSDWVKGRYSPKDEMYILVLAEKLGKWVYKVLDVKPINPLRAYVLRNWDKTPKEMQVQIAKTISKHTSDPLPNELSEKSTANTK
jgi:hypothetical protein